MQKFIKRTSITELVNKVKVVCRFEHINILDNIRTTLECGKNVNLIDSAFLKLGYFSKFFCLNYFDCHLLLGYQVDCFIDFSVNSLSELLLKLVIFNDLPHFIITQAAINS